MIDVYDENKEFTKEFKDLVDKYIQEEILKVTTDGKFDRQKAIEYIKNYLNRQEKTKR